MYLRDIIWGVYGMKNKILQLLLVIILCIVSIFATYCYTMEKNIIKLDDFYGTYSLVEAQNVYNGQYLAIVPCEDNNSNKGSFIIYNQQNDSRIEGEWNWSDKGLLSLQKDGERIGIIGYINDNYIYINNQEISKVEKVSDYAVMN